MPEMIAKPKVIHWVALFLLVISVCINYIDRGNLSVAGKSIESDLNISQGQLGVLFGGFFWTYSLLQIAAGKVIDRYNVNWVYAIGFLLWSGCTAATGLATGFYSIFAMRLLIGAGESVAYPAYSKIISSTFPEGLRGTANALIDAGSKVGPALGVLVGVKLVNWLSWRGMFFAIGAVSLIWLIPWSVIVPHLKVRVPEKAGSEHITLPTYKEILSKRAVWGTIIGLFGANYTWYFFLTWLPYYFEHERHYTHDKLAFLGSLPFWFVAASSMLAGLGADAIIRRGRPAARVRQTSVVIGLTGCCAFMAASILVGNARLSLGLLLVASFLYGLFSSNHWALTQSLAGPEVAGKWTGVENCAGNFAGVVAAYITGQVLSITHVFFYAFAIACAVLLFGAWGFWFVIGKTQRVQWNFEVPAPPASANL